MGDTASKTVSDQPRLSYFLASIPINSIFVFGKEEMRTPRAVCRCALTRGVDLADFYQKSRLIHGRTILRVENVPRYLIAAKGSFEQIEMTLS
jgi:hypothetical protein